MAPSLTTAMEALGTPVVLSASATAESIAAVVAGGNVFCAKAAGNSRADASMGRNLKRTKNSPLVVDAQYRRSKHRDSRLVLRPQAVSVPPRPYFAAAAKPIKSAAPATIIIIKLRRWWLWCAGGF